MYSIPLMKDSTLTIGSRIAPEEGSASKVLDVDSGSSIIAATTAEREEYLEDARYHSL